MLWMKFPNVITAFLPFYYHHSSSSPSCSKRTNHKLEVSTTRRSLVFHQQHPLELSSSSPFTYWKPNKKCQSLTCIQHHYSRGLLELVDYDSFPPSSSPFNIDIRDTDKEHDKNNENHKPFISNSVKTANFMLYWPDITTFTLVKGWNNHTMMMKDLQSAVQNVLIQNPVLTGKVTTTRRGMFLQNLEIRIIPNSFPLDAKKYVHEINLPSSSIIPSDFDTLSQREILQFMDDTIAPLIPKGKFVIDHVKDGDPLFGIDVISLKNGYACYVMRLSHCIGDGITYYNIMDEINREFNNHNNNIENGNNNNIKNHKNSNQNQHKSIDWDNKQIGQHEIFPNTFSDRDFQIAYGFPFLLGLLRNIPFMKEDEKEYLLLSKEKIRKKRDELLLSSEHQQQEQEHNHISSNDVITAALCETNESSDLFAFTFNGRNHQDCKIGGNFHLEIPFPKKVVASNPNQFRTILKKGGYYETNSLPMCPFVLGKVGRISSLATVQKLIMRNDDMKLVCHTMLSSFVQNVPMDVAFISSMNDDNFVILHNFKEMKIGGLLKDIMID